MSKRAQALLDTSVIVDLDIIDESRLPDECSIATITLADLSAGVHAAAKSALRAARQEILQLRVRSSQCRSIPKLLSLTGASTRHCSRLGEAAWWKGSGLLHSGNSTLPRASVTYAQCGGFDERRESCRSRRDVSSACAESSTGPCDRPE